MTVRIFTFFIVAASVASGAKLEIAMSSNTFIRNSDTPTALGKFVVWNNQAWHYDSDNKLKVWQSSSQRWKDITKSVIGSFPSQRNSFNFAVANDKFFLYGGADVNGKIIPSSDNFYSFDPSASFAWSRLDSTSDETLPYLRVLSGLVGYASKIYLFGGMTPDFPATCQTGGDCFCLPMYDGKEKRCMLNDLHEYDAKSGKWRLLNQPGGVKPSERVYFGFTAGQNKLYVLGGLTLRSDAPGAIGMASWTGLNSCGDGWGLNGVYRMQDLWSYDLDSNEWTALAPPVRDVGLTPGFTLYGQNLLSMGGFNGNDRRISYLTGFG